MEGGGGVAAHRPQKPVSGVEAIIDVNGIKYAARIILNAVKEKQKFELKAGDSIKFVITGASGVYRVLLTI